MDFSTTFRRERLHIYLITILGIFGFIHLIDSLIYFKYSFFILFAFAALHFGLMALLIRRHRKKSTEPTDTPPEEIFQKLFDKYTRRCVNWTLIAFLYVFITALSLIVLGINSKGNEILEGLIGHYFGFEVIAFFLVKNLLIVKWLCGQHDFEKLPLFRKELRNVILSSAIYWIIAGALFYGFEMVFVMDITAFIAVLFAAWIVAYNFTRINRFTYSRKKHPRAVIATVLLIALVGGGYSFLSRDVWLTQPYINSTPHLYESENRITYDDATGIYTITKSTQVLKILQVTDVHLGGGVLSFDKDLKALKAVFALLDKTRPDLVIVTGDLCYPIGLSSFSFNNTAPVQQFAAFMRNTGIPWAFTYGNHDTERFAATSTHGLNELYKSLSWDTSRTLLYPYIQPDITGRNNQLIEVRNSDGSLNQALFLIDSNAYTGEGLNKYDYIHDDQVEWYADQVKRLNTEAGRTVPSLVFFHIPLQQYRTAYELYEKGSTAVKYYFGSNDEDMFNKVCCSDYPSSMFDKAKELGSTTGFFCGHDHYNNMSLEYQGIRLTYGMSIDYLAMPGIARDTKQRGATLITVDEYGNTEIEQIPLLSVTCEQ